jgi:hypothetical protein
LEQPIAIDEASAGLLDAQFDVRGGDGGVLLLHGVRDATEVVRLLLGKPTPCLGRDTELAALDTALRQCITERRARAVLITAPGLWLLKRRGRNVAALHGGLSQRERDRTLAEFKAGEVQYLVATNVASRGLDITDLPYVLNYDIPEDAETYVHRVGRTARAGKQGTAITFVGEWDIDVWEQMREAVGATVEERQLDLYADRT